MSGLDLVPEFPMGYPIRLRQPLEGFSCTKDIPSLLPQAGDLVTSCVAPSPSAFSSQSTSDP